MSVPAVEDPMSSQSEIDIKIQNPSVEQTPIKHINLIDETLNEKATFVED
jgi:hypothetical protein